MFLSFIKYVASFHFRVVQHHVDVSTASIFGRQTSPESEFDAVDAKSSNIDVTTTATSAATTTAATADASKNDVSVVIDPVVEDRRKDPGTRNAPKLGELWNPTDASGSGKIVRFASDKDFQNTRPSGSS